MPKIWDISVLQERIITEPSPRHHAAPNPHRSTPASPAFIGCDNPFPNPSPQWQYLQGLTLSATAVLPAIRCRCGKNAETWPAKCIRTRSHSRECRKVTMKRRFCRHLHEGSAEVWPAEGPMDGVPQLRVPEGDDEKPLLSAPSSRSKWVPLSKTQTRATVGVLHEFHSFRRSREMRESTTPYEGVGGNGGEADSLGRERGASGEKYLFCYPFMSKFVGKTDRIWDYV